MSAAIAAAVAAGSALGAVGRYLIDRFVQSLGPTVLPWGTFTVNTGGSLVLGLVVAAAASGALPGAATAALGTGFCGALTTFSTLSYETLRLAESGARGYAALNVVLTVMAGLAAASLGWWAGFALLG
ncbi:fluoride efflux transporter CrcB [Nocardiopsis sp. NRRL B-16309]|uniref:fluoride efflux transporter CrcB n=1 Tax=Nocardiopsis sp. NRRL B-16309 TaxID=1519494 RepID=UPI000B32696B|nr:fluoride efflux transporter CrcB [Nocardiopsis sp. NRRL B-16309]